MDDPTNSAQRALEDLQRYLDCQLVHLEQREREAVSAAADTVTLEQFGTAAVHMHQAARLRLAREELTLVRMRVRSALLQ
jgi:hypothetical protein